MFPAARSRSSCDAAPEAISAANAAPRWSGGPGISTSSPARNDDGAAVAAVPVAHDDTVETPVAAQDVAEQPLVLGAERPVEPVVGGHHAAHAGTRHRRLERDEVELAQRLLVDLDGDGHPLELGVVGDEVLDARGHADGAAAPRCSATASSAVSTGSSPKHSKLRPPIGVRARLTVGPSSTLTPRAMHSRARAAPISATSSGSNVAPSAAPHGNESDGGPVHDVPRTPAGPSDILIAGTGGSSIWAVCHTSAPAISATSARADQRDHSRPHSSGGDRTSARLLSRRRRRDASAAASGSGG